ncbi:ABC transporter ATP-binding protein [Butyrivibrio sp. AC2005]|uniref:ABC transporter ATP-binding protein n=1 Tax=Butyrivibrio sp. AC2005 TaxID=1280672 RepID=UPI0003F8D47D|nr:ABC transporter ATP-binding protein [Butyrivibrio sp. AC2005]
MSDNEILNMKGIVKDYVLGDEVSRVLKGINLSVKRGEFLAILGPSGSGKSTLMNIIGCLDVPTEGEYRLSGKLIADQDEASLAQIRNKEVGFIFQQFQLLQRQTAYENVELPLIYANMPEKERHDRVIEMLDKVQLAHKVNHYPNQLSGGQQQRVAIARAIAANPTILLADEPTGALDQKTGAQIIDLFHSLNDEGRTIIMITHDRHIASHASRIVRILDGELSEGDLSDA